MCFSWATFEVGHIILVVEDFRLHRVKCFRMKNRRGLPHSCQYIHKTEYHHEISIIHLVHNRQCIQLLLAPPVSSCIMRLFVFECHNVHIYVLFCSFLVRFQHVFEKDEPNPLARPIAFSTDDYFAEGFKPSLFKEMTLSGNREK